MREYKQLLRLLVIGLGLILVVGCSGADNQSGQPLKQTCTVSADTDNLVKILLIYDMEGVAGQNILTSIDFPRPEYFDARELLTTDVNAVIDGLVTGGADSIFVVDGHGSFNPEPDILLDKMDSRAQMLFKKEKFHPYVDLLDENSYDAVVAVAMHSRTGGGGFAEHTVNLGTNWILNGMPVNESEIVAYSWGRKGIPLIFVSGDDKLAEQLNWMDWLEYVTVKEAHGIDDALLYPVEEVHARMKEAAERAVRNRQKAKAVRLTEPITATLQVKPPADLSLLANVPGVDYRDQSVTFVAEDFQAAYDGMRGLMTVAQYGLYDIAAGILFAQGQESFTAFKDGVFEAWRKGVQEPPDQSGTDPETETDSGEQLYFGSR
ncbi:MAG TPA: M55 family metallopeptidase [candidate division Zixibacteria bacterium]|nr:M55 family metallopeptidase [candidate division Zixibacteria bacterium]